MKRPFNACTGDAPYIFVCYTHDDMNAVYPEIQRLHEAGVRIWYDEAISPGTRWSDELARALSKASLVLFFCTPRSVESQHCQDEVNFALDEKPAARGPGWRSRSIPGSAPATWRTPIDPETRAECGAVYGQTDGGDQPTCGSRTMRSFG